MAPDEVLDLKLRLEASSRALQRIARNILFDQTSGWDLEDWSLWVGRVAQVTIDFNLTHTGNDLRHKPQ